MNTSINIMRRFFFGRGGRGVQNPLPQLISTYQIVKIKPQTTQNYPIETSFQKHFLDYENNTDFP